MLNNTLPPVTATPLPAPTPAAHAPAPAAPNDGPDSFAQALSQADGRQAAARHVAAGEPPPAARKAAHAAAGQTESTDDSAWRVAICNLPPSPEPVGGSAPVVSSDEADSDTGPTSDTPLPGAAGLPLVLPLPPRLQAPTAGGSERTPTLRPGPAAPGEKTPRVDVTPAPDTKAPTMAWRGSAEAFADTLRQAAAPAAEARSADTAPPLPVAFTAPAATTVAASAPAEARIAASPGSPDFATQLGTQLTTFVREGVQHARLELHPVELGPVTVQIELDGRNAQVNLAADHAQTRQALEQALPQLAGSLREAGLTLSGGGVFEQPRQAPQDNPARDARRLPPLPDDAGPQRTIAAPSLRRRGVVDLVA